MGEVHAIIISAMLFLICTLHLRSLVLIGGTGKKKCPTINTVNSDDTPISLGRVASWALTQQLCHWHLQGPSSSIPC